LGVVIRKGREENDPKKMEARISCPTGCRLGNPTKGEKMIHTIGEKGKGSLLKAERGVVRRKSPSGKKAWGASAKAKAKSQARGPRQRGQDLHHPDWTKILVERGEGSRKYVRGEIFFPFKSSSAFESLGVWD